MASTVWQGRISFGLVAIPVRLFKAARRERARFHRVYQAPEPEEEPEELPVRRAPAPVAPGPRLVVPEPAEEEAEDAAVTGPVVRVHHQAVSGDEERAPIEAREILKGYEIEKDRYAVFAPAEVAALRPATSTELQITEFSRLNEIDPIYFDTSYYVAPNRGGERAYAVLFRALKESGFVALGNLAMHGREHATVIRPGQSGMILHTMFFANEVRSSEEYRAEAELSPKELDLAKKLIEAAAAPFDPTKLKDTFEERLQALIASRAGAAVSLQPGAEGPPPAPAVDLMEALRRSLEAIRKPAAREETVRRPAKSASPRTRRQRPARTS